MEKFVFPSHTSVISRNLLVSELHKQGIEASDGSSAPKKAAKSADEIIEVKTSLQIREELIMKKKNLRPVVLEETFDTGLPEG
jgi:hypothetical protein